MSVHPLRKVRRTADANVAAMTAATLVTVATTVLLFVLLPPIAWIADRPVEITPVRILRIVGRLVTEGGLGRLVQEGENLIRLWDVAGALLWRLAAIAFGGFTCWLVASEYIWKRLIPSAAVEHLQGPKLLYGGEAIREARYCLSEQIRQSGRGIEIAPSVFIPRRMEVLHHLILGAVGSGKTVVLRGIIEQYISRGSRLIVHDSKGEYTEGLPVDIALLAPHHADSFAWDISSDIASEQSAREFASRIIPSSHDPMWSSGAREVMTGLLVGLQQSTPNWSWKDLLNVVCAEPIATRSALSRHYPSAASFIEIDSDGEVAKTSLGILISMWAAAASILRPLALAWGEAPLSRRISLGKWLQGKDPRALVLQRSAEFPELSRIWIGAAIDLISAQVCGSSRPDTDDRLAIVLDELPQLGMLKSLSQLLEVGRSKGLVVILGVQDREQLRQIYGPETTASWLSMIGTKIILRLNAGESADWASRVLIGSRDVGWREESKTYTRSGAQVTSSQQRASLPLMTPSELQSELGLKTTADGVRIRGLLLGVTDVLCIDWHLITWTRRRAAHRPAAWLMSQGSPLHSSSIPQSAQQEGSTRL